jgi:hypothetical protein
LITLPIKAMKSMLGPSEAPALTVGPQPLHMIHHDWSYLSELV